MRHSIENGITRIIRLLVAYLLLDSLSTVRPFLVVTFVGI